MSKPVQNNGKMPGGITGKGMKPGETRNPGGRPKLDPDVKAMLVSATPGRIRRLEKLSAKAEKKGDLKTAAHIEISLLKKTVPDTEELLFTTPNGEPLKVEAEVVVAKMPPVKRLQRIAEILKRADALPVEPVDDSPAAD